MTIDVPGNVPYVITTGALTDNYTPYNLTDDRLASFSSAGPTYEGFVKPEVIAPGGHMVASMSSQSYLANIDPGSMAPDRADVHDVRHLDGRGRHHGRRGVDAAVRSVALTPDDVKCRLLASARPAVTSTGTLAYSVFQQGAGLINAVSAVNSSATGCANHGLNIAADLAGTQHFGGPANEDANGNYYVMNMPGSTWGARTVRRLFLVDWPTSGPGLYLERGLHLEPGLYLEPGLHLEQRLHLEQGLHLVKGYTWSKSVPWWTSNASPGGAAQPASIETWVPNQ